MVFKPGHKPEKNNKQQKYSAWKFARELRSLKTTELAIQKLEELMNSDDESIVLGALKFWADRALGKAQDVNQFDGAAGGASQVTFNVTVKVPEQQAIDVSPQPVIRAIPKAVRSLS